MENIPSETKPPFSEQKPQNFNSGDPVPASHSLGYSGAKLIRNKWLWIFLVAAVIVVLAIVMAFNIIKRSNLNKGNNQNSVSVQPEYVATVAGTLTMLEGKSKLVIPKVTDQSPVNFADLPAEIQTILAQASTTAVTVEKLNFEEGKTGYNISYSLKIPLQDAYFQLLTATKSWKILYSTRAKLAAIYQAQNQLYQLQIVFKMAGDNNTDINIQIIKQ